jgi:hypothetical protein
MSFLDCKMEITLFEKRGRQQDVQQTLDQKSLAISSARDEPSYLAGVSGHFHRYSLC